MVSGNYNSSNQPTQNVLNLTSLSSYDQLARSQDIRLHLGGSLDVAARISAVGRESVFSRVLSNFKSVRLVVNTSDDNVKYCDLNIRSVAKRLGISHRQVKEIARQPNALEILSKMALVKIQTFAKCYNILMNSDVLHGHLVKQGTSLHIRSKHLHDVVKKAIDLTMENPEELQFKSFKLYGKRFFVGKSPEEEPRIFSSTYVGEGNFGKVYEITCLETANSFALKKAKSKVEDQESEIPLKNLKHETKILRKINPTGSLEGIQKAPYSNVIDGMYIAPLYSGDFITHLTAFESLPIRRKLELCRQLLSGLYALHDEGYVHGDIKPENCLVELGRESHLPEKIVIGDFGGVQKIRQNMKHCSHTKIYIPPDVNLHLEMGYHNSTVIESCDVYAMCKTIIEMLVGGDEGRSGMDNILVNDSDSFDQISGLLREKGVPKEISEILLNGLFPFEVRPDSEQLYNAFCVGLQRTGLG